MYLSLLRTSQWNASGHVCLACRRHLLAISQQTQKYLTTSTEPQAAQQIHIEPLQKHESPKQRQDAFLRLSVQSRHAPTAKPSGSDNKVSKSIKSSSTGKKRPKRASSVAARVTSTQTAKPNHGSSASAKVKNSTPQKKPPTTTLASRGGQQSRVHNRRRRGPSNTARKTSAAQPSSDVNSKGQEQGREVADTDATKVADPDAQTENDPLPAQADAQEQEQDKGKNSTDFRRLVGFGKVQANIDATKTADSNAETRNDHSSAQVDVNEQDEGEKGFKVRRCLVANGNARPAAPRIGKDADAEQQTSRSTDSQPAGTGGHKTTQAASKTAVTNSAIVSRAHRTSRATLKTTVAKSAKVSQKPDGVGKTYSAQNFGGAAADDVALEMAPESSTAESEARVTQDRYNAQGFGLSKIQQDLNATHPKFKGLLGNLRKRFFLPARKEQQQQASRLKALGPRLRFADLVRREADKSKTSEDAQKNGPSVTTEGITTDAPANLAMPETVSINVKALSIEPLSVEQPPIAKLSFGLDRVLFNPGVFQLQDPHSRVYNFDPYLQNIMSVQEFDYNALKQYKTSSEDRTLSDLAKAHGKRYIGSTSSMTSSLAHFHYLLSHFRNINAGMLSRQFAPDYLTFTRINRAPSSIFLRWQNGTYAIDADKECDTPNVLMMLGKSMEKLLTMPKDDFERYRKSDPREISEEERNEPEAFQFTTMGDMLMRSQLDAYDDRLPGNGTFDLKTRAVVSIRMDARNYENMLGYELLTLQGEFNSYEREYFDMIRSTMLKYMLQARMGCMDGIFMAYHNIERLFGFQYLPMYEIDRAIHGQIDRCLGDQEFKLSLRMFNDVLNAATAKFPEQSLRVTFETEGAVESELVVLRIFAEPVSDADIDTIQSKSKARMADYEEKVMSFVRDEDVAEDVDEALEATLADSVEDSSATSSDVELIQTSETRTKEPLFSALILVESRVNDEIVVRPINLKPSDEWTVNYSLVEFDDSRLDEAWAFYAQAKARRKKILKKGDETDGDESTTKKASGYIEMLRKLAANGREFRSKMDKAEAGKEPVVWTP